MTNQPDPSEGKGGQLVAPGGYSLLALLTLLNVLNFVDRQLISSFANFIVPDLGLTNTEFGLITGLFFVVFYAVAGLFMGLAADLVHRPRLIAGAVLLWSSLTAASGAARGFVSLAVPRMLIGIGESALTPTAMSLLADRFQSKNLGFAAGVYYMGVPIGAGLSLLLAGFLGPVIGWRNCFYGLGAIGLLLVPFILLVREDRPKRRIAGGFGAGVNLKDLFRVFAATLGRSRPLQFTIAAAVCLHFVVGAAAFDQLWLVQERGFERSEIAILSGWIGVCGGVLGNLFGGVAVDIWVRKTGQSRARFLFWLFIVLVPFNFAYRFADPEVLLFWVGLFLAFFQLGAFYGPAFSAIQELSPAEVRATVTAFAILLMNVVGVGGGVTLGGLAIDHLIAAGVADPFTWTLLGFTIVSALSIPLFFFAGKSAAS